MESVEKEFKELMAQKIENENKILNEKIANYKIRYLLLEIVLTLTGYGILIYHYPWVALGVWLAKWGNNMSLVREIHRNKNSFIKEIWKNY